MFGIVTGHHMCHGGVMVEGDFLNQFLASGISFFGGKTSNDIFIMMFSLLNGHGVAMDLLLHIFF